jgi:hypothetical protein
MKPAIHRTGLLAFCWPKTPLEIGLLALVSIMSITGISVVLSGPFDRLDLRFAFVWAFFIFAFLTTQLARLVKVTRTLRLLKSPNSTATLLRTLSWLGLSWGLVCALFFLFDGLHGCLFILTLTGILVMLYAQAFYLPAESFWLYGAFPLSIMQGLKYFDGWIAIAVTAFAIIAALMSARAARFAWHNLEFALAAPKAINFNAPDNTNIGRRMENLTGELSGDSFPDMLRFFGLGSLAAHARYALWLVTLVAAAGFAAYFWLPWDRVFLWLGALAVALCILFLISTDGTMLALYGCKKERAFLCTLPGLPSAEIQSKLLRHAFWLRIAIPNALLFLALATGIAISGKYGALSFVCTACASGLIAARLMEIRISNYASGNKLDSLLGIFAPFVILAGAFFAVISKVREAAGLSANASMLTAGLAVALAAAAFFAPRSKPFALALTKKE